MRAFTIAFANILSSQLSFYSIMSVSHNFKNIDVVATKYPTSLYDNRIQKFIILLNCSCPILWNKKKECLIYNYIYQTTNEKELIYFDLDVFMTPGASILFQNVFDDSMFEYFDVSYIHRGFKSKWGIVNTGIVLFRNTKQTKKWLHEMYKVVIYRQGDPQLTIDALLSVSTRKIFSSFVVNQTQFLLLPSKPYNMLSKWRDCKETGVHHYHGPYKSNLFKCLKFYPKWI